MNCTFSVVLAQPFIHEGWSPIWIFVFLGAPLLFGVVTIVIIAAYGRLWIEAYMCKAQVGIVDLIAMTLRRVDPRVIVRGKILAMQSGLPPERLQAVTNQALERHYLTGGNVPKLIRATIVAHKAGIDLDFAQAAAIDLAGYDVLQVAKAAVEPRVIDCPPPGKGDEEGFRGAAKDGVELSVRVRLVVRVDLQRAIGGGTEETLMANVAGGIVSAVGSMKNHRQVFENPDLITAQLLLRGLTTATSYEILSVSVVEVKVGGNVSEDLRREGTETSVPEVAAEVRDTPPSVVADRNLPTFEIDEGTENVDG